MKVKTHPKRVKGSLPQPANIVENSGLLTPEFVRISKIPYAWGISRSHTWLKIADGTFESVHVVQPGCKRGVRLVRVDSIRRYLASFAK